MTLELSMTMTMVAVLVIDECFAERVHTALEPVADVLEGLTVGRGRRAIRDLLDPLPAIESGRRSGGTAQSGEPLPTEQRIERIPARPLRTVLTHQNARLGAADRAPSCTHFFPTKPPTFS